MVISMFYKHLIVKNGDGEEVLYLFINNNFEFSKEFGNQNEVERKESMFARVKHYLKTRRVKFDGTKIFLVVSGVVIGTILLSNATIRPLDINPTPKSQYMVSLDKFDEIKIPDKNNIEIVIPIQKDDTEKATTETQTKNDQAVNTQTVTTTVQKPVVTNTSTSKSNNSPQINTNVPTTNIQTSATNSTSSPPSTPPSDPEPAPTNPPPQQETTQVPSFTNPVNIHMADGSIQTMEFEDFIVGVVAAEMPASFQTEALKAQALATRTYYLKALSQGKMITQINSGQITYKTIDDLKSLWGSSFDTYYLKVKNAVYSTTGEYITYNGTYIEAVYCSTNNGRSESSMDVWGNYYPYLISVDSPWDVNATSYSRETDKDLSVIDSILGINIDQNTPIQVIDRTDNSSVKDIMIGDKTYTGLYLRSALGLRSTDFDLSISNGVMHITTRGYGHGVGLSQYGANGMASEGYTYRQIISHYYPGTTIEK